MERLNSLSKKSRLIKNAFSGLFVFGLGVAVGHGLDRLNSLQVDPGVTLPPPTEGVHGVKQQIVYPNIQEEFSEPLGENVQDPLVIKRYLTKKEGAPSGVVTGKTDSSSKMPLDGWEPSNR